MGDETLRTFFRHGVSCRVEHDILMKISEEKTVRLFGINYKDQTQAAIRWLQELGDPFERIVADRDGRVAIDWGVMASQKRI